MTSAFSKSSVCVCLHVHAKTAFLKSSTLESVSKSSVFIDRFHEIRVDGSRTRKEKVAFSNENGYVWTGPKSTCYYAKSTYYYLGRYS